MWACPKQVKQQLQSHNDVILESIAAIGHLS